MAAGESVLFHAAAGGVGQVLVQLAVARGARVLALASTQAKCDVARAAGAEIAITYDGGWVATDHAFDAGGVHVAYESIGSPLCDSLRALRTGGTAAFYGMAGGDPALIDPRTLMDGSKTLTGGDLWNMLETGSDRRERAADLFDAIRNGCLRTSIDSRYALADDAAAHAHLESRNALSKGVADPIAEPVVASDAGITGRRFASARPVPPLRSRQVRATNPWPKWTTRSSL